METKNFLRAVNKFFKALLEVLSTKFLQLGLCVYSVASVPMGATGRTASCHRWMFHVGIYFTLHRCDPLDSLVFLFQL